MDDLTHCSFCVVLQVVLATKKISPFLSLLIVAITATVLLGMSPAGPGLAGVLLLNASMTACKGVPVFRVCGQFIIESRQLADKLL